MGLFNRSASTTKTAYNTDNSNIAAQDEGLAVKAGGNVIIDSEKSVARAFEFGGEMFSQALDSVGSAYEANISANSKMSSNALEGVKTAFQSATLKTDPVNQNVALGIFALLLGGGLYFTVGRK